MFSLTTLPPELLEHSISYLGKKDRETLSCLSAFQESVLFQTKRECFEFQRAVVAWISESHQSSPGKLNLKKFCTGDALEKCQNLVTINNVIKKIRQIIVPDHDLELDKKENGIGYEISYEDFNAQDIQKGIPLEELADFIDIGEKYKHCPALTDLMSLIDKHYLSYFRRHSQSFSYDKKVILRAIKLDGTMLRFGSNDLKSDPEFVIPAIKQNGRALEFAHIFFKKDLETVRLAVHNDGYALLFAIEQIRADRQTVELACENNGLAIKCASESLKKNSELALVAIGQNSRALEYIDPSLKENLKFLKAVKDLLNKQTNH